MDDLHPVIAQKLAVATFFDPNSFSLTFWRMRHDRLFSYIFWPVPAISHSGMLSGMNHVTINPRQAIHLMNDSQPVATWRCQDDLPKPGFHPLTTPNGRVLSGWEPSDHRWHRGLWFSLKFIGEDNFWEEDEHSGKQVSLEHPSITYNQDDSWTLEHRLAWRRSSGQDALIELRRIRIEVASEAVRLDWHTQLSVLEDARIDRTPYTTWGGYTGLGFRSTREWHNVRFHQPNGECEGVAGEALPWLAADGLLDGPFKEDSQPAAGGILIVVDPQHPRYPVPFYAKTGGGFTFLNPAFLFHEGMDLQKDHVLDLRYRVVTVDGRWGDNLPAEVARAEEALR